MSQQIRGQGGHFVFPINLKNTNLVEGVEILLPIKFRRIPFTVSEEKSKMSQPIRFQGGHLVFFFPICLKNTNVVEGIESLLPVKLLNSVQRFQRRSKKCHSQSEARAAILFFRPAQKHKLGRGR